MGPARPCAPPGAGPPRPVPRGAARNLSTGPADPQIRVTGTLQKSTEVMAMVQSLVSVPTMAATMRDMQASRRGSRWTPPRLARGTRGGGEGGPGARRRAWQAGRRSRGPEGPLAGRES